MNNDRFARLPEVSRITGLSRPHIYRLMSENRFPRSYKLSERAVGWRVSDIEEWMAARQQNAA
jgi:prophage regulatory protein